MSKASDRRKALKEDLKNWPKDVGSEPFNDAELRRKAQEQAAKTRAERDGEK